MPEVVQLLLLVIRYYYVYIKSMRVTKTYNEDCIHCVLISRNIAGIHPKDLLFIVNELRMSAKYKFLEKNNYIDLVTIVIIDL